MEANYFDRNYCAIVTPFKKDSLEIDYDAFRKYIRYFTQDQDFIKHRGSFIVNPEASEMFYMTSQERQNLIKIMMEERLDGMPIFAGVFGVTVGDAIKCALEAKALGVDGIFLFPPTGTMEVSIAIDNVNYPETWTLWVKAIDNAVDLPIILHPAAPMSLEWGQSLAIETVKMLMEEIPNIVGYKMIYQLEVSHFRIARFLRSLPRHVSILNPPPYAWPTAQMCGLVDGTVQGAWNWNKEAMLKYLNAWDAGDLRTVSTVRSEQILPLWEYVYGGGKRIHPRYKIATWIRGLISHPFMLPPMPPPRREECETLYSLMQKAGFSVISKAEFEETLKKQDSILSTAVNRN